MSLVYRYVSSLLEQLGRRARHFKSLENPIYCLGNYWTTHSLRENLKKTE